MRKSISRLPLLLAAAATLAGCSYLQREAGFTKMAPDEFAVTTKAALVIPPDYNLRPPTPGAAPTNAVDPNTVAQNALFNNSDPTAVAAQMKGDYSPSEKLLLATAGAGTADPSIRQQLQSDQGARQGADPSFTAKLLGTKASPNDGNPINADAELEKRKGASATVPQQKKESGGWFDWF